MGDVSTKSLIYALSGEVKEITHQLKIMKENQSDMKTDLNEIAAKINDPESGMIVKTNRNTEFREMCEPERKELIAKFQGVLRWKSTIEWGGGAVFVAVLGAIIKIIFFS